MDKISISEFNTPLGEMIACATNEGLSLLDYKSPQCQLKIKKLEQLLNMSSVVEENEHTRQTKKELEEYFKSNRNEFSVKLANRGTEFQQKVWEKILLVKYGSTTTYEKLSLSLNNALAIRAVAHAVATNPIMIIIPCHRIIGKNGNLTGYAGGLTRKQQLIDLESKTSLFGPDF